MGLVLIVVNYKHFVTNYSRNIRLNACATKLSSHYNKMTIAKPFQYDCRDFMTPTGILYPRRLDIYCNRLSGYYHFSWLYKSLTKLGVKRR